MARYPILGEIAQAVADFLGTELKNAGVKAEVTDTLPDGDSTKPVVHFVLADARQSLDRRETEALPEQERLKDGTIVDYLRDPPIYLDLTYLMFATGPVAAAHAALARAVLTLKDRPSLDTLPSVKELYIARDESMALRLLHSYEPAEVGAMMQRMGIAAKPALVYGCCARIESEKRREVKRVEERILDFQQKERPR
jgi:hypothetical protein